MKLLLAISATNHKNLEDGSIRWCGRLGFELKVFVPKNKRSRYKNVIADANYHYYLALEPDTLVSRTDAMSYAQQHGYGLLVTVPERLPSWHKRTAYDDVEVKLAYEAIDFARGEFVKNPRKRIKRWTNGVTIERVL